MALREKFPFDPNANYERDGVAPDAPGVLGGGSFIGNANDSEQPPTLDPSTSLAGLVYVDTTAAQGPKKPGPESDAWVIAPGLT